MESMEETCEETWSAGAVRAVVRTYAAHEGPLLPILHALQEEFGYIPSEAERLIAQELNLSRADIHGVVSFYHDFRHAPAGRHVLKLCRAEACQSLGSEAQSRKLLDALGLDWGGTTPDGRLTVEAVYCLGLCATAPAALFDKTPCGRLDLSALETLAAEAI